MTVNDFRRSFDGRFSANKGMQRSSDETKGAASSGPIAESATTLTADDILLLADGPAGSLKGPHWVEPPVLGRGREGPVTGAVQNQISAGGSTALDGSQPSVIPSQTADALIVEGDITNTAKPPSLHSGSCEGRERVSGR
jgi:hypothetical protein